MRKGTWWGLGVAAAVAAGLLPGSSGQARGVSSLTTRQAQGVSSLAAGAAQASGVTSRVKAGVGGRVAYVGADGNVYVAGRDGAGKRALTRDGTAASPYAALTWSPTGAGLLALRYAFGLQAVKSPVAGLWLVSASGGSRRLMPAIPRGFAWAPDGRTVVYEQGYPPDATLLTQLDTRSGAQRTTPCPAAFALKGVTGGLTGAATGGVTGAARGAGRSTAPAAGGGYRAIGVQGDQIESVALADGAAKALTTYSAHAGVWQGLATLDGPGRAVLYSVTPGTRLISLDLRSGRSGSVSVSDPVVGLAPSADGHWIAYATGTPGLATQSVLVRVGKGAATLPSGASIAAQAFAPDASALAFTVHDGASGGRSGGSTGSTGSTGSAAMSSVYTAPTTCPARCARRLDTGEDAVWGP